MLAAERGWDGRSDVMGLGVFAGMFGSGKGGSHSVSGTYLTVLELLF